MNKKGWVAIEEFVLKHDYCTGCGVCAGVCPVDVLEMRFNAKGEYEPELIGKCIDCGLCSIGCPFVTENATEDEMAEGYYGTVPDVRHHPDTGYYLTSYVGHIREDAHRWAGASGGMASWFMQTLLREGIVDHVICVAQHEDANKLYTFEVVSSHEDILRTARSAYYPVEMSAVLDHVMKHKGRYALIGLPCFIKGARLASLKMPKLKSRIVLYAGITCGQLVTKGFAESITRSMYVDPARLTAFNFRDKVPERPATNFNMTATTAEGSTSVQWQSFCELAWMSSMFKPNACNYCDDAFAELADVCFMDAWLPEYRNESHGTSIVLVRSPEVDDVIRRYGIEGGECALENLSHDKVMQSQAQVIKNKREVLQNRLWLDARAGRPVPEKRLAPKRPNIFGLLRLWSADTIRKRSVIALDKQRDSGAPGLEVYMAEMKVPLLIRDLVAQFCRLQNLKRGLTRRMGVVWNRITMRARA